MTVNTDSEAAVTPQRQLIWDLPVRVFHWTLVAAVIAAFVTNKLGINYFKYHVWCGYVVIVLTTFRIVWGVVGTHHARFWHFVRGPRSTLQYTYEWLTHREPSHAGHNPLGAWMILVLLAGLFAQAFIGLFGNDEIFNVGPLYAYISNDLSLTLTSVHRKLAYWILAAIALHIIAIIVHRIFKKENLVTTMITGYKPQHAVTDHSGIVSSRTWLAILLILSLGFGLAWIVNHAPVAATDISY